MRNSHQAGKKFLSAGMHSSPGGNRHFLSLSWGLPSHTLDFLGCSISPRLLVVEARLRLWRTRKVPLVGLIALEDELHSRHQAYVVRIHVHVYHRAKFSQRWYCD